MECDPDCECAVCRGEYDMNDMVDAESYRQMQWEVAQLQEFRSAFWEVVQLCRAKGLHPSPGMAIHELLTERDLLIEALDEVHR